MEQVLTGETGQRVYTGGVTNMLSQPEFRDIDKLRSMFSIIEQDDQVEKLLSAPICAEKGAVKVTIGGEMPIPEAQDCSVVVANYFINGEKAGSIGVLGPTRLNYDRTVSLVETIAGEISRVLSDEEE